MLRVTLLLLTFPMISATSSSSEINETAITMMKLYETYEDIYHHENPIVSSFLRHHICPDMIPAPPEKKLHVLYKWPCRARFGNRIRRKFIVQLPRVDWQGDATTLYTLIMYNPDVPEKNITFRKWHPWVVGNIPGRRNIFFGDILFNYQMSENPRNIGEQRHVFLLYKQIRRIKFDKKDYFRPATLASFNLKKFIFKYDLGNPEYGNFFSSFEE